MMTTMIIKNNNINSSRMYLFLENSPGAGLQLNILYTDSHLIPTIMYYLHLQMKKPGATDMEELV